MGNQRRETGTNRGKSSASGRTRAASATAVSPGRSAPSNHSPGRSKSASDRVSHTDATSTRSGPAKRGGVKPRGTGLRAKFMLVLSGVTVLTMIFLGLLMTTTTNKYLFSQKQHDGLEIARLAAQVATAVADRIAQYDREHPDTRNDATSMADRKKIGLQIEGYLKEAVSWDGLANASDILAIAYDTERIPELSRLGYGPTEEGNTTKIRRYKQIFLAKSGDNIVLPDSVEVFEGTKITPQGSVPIYRFKVPLDPGRFGERANVRVDIDSRGVDNVRQNLAVAITISVLIAIAVVIVVANWLAGSITRPVHILLKDMQVVARGDLEHQTKPHSSDEIGILAHEFNRMTENLKEAQSALVEQEKAEYELSIAREVQKQLLPAEPPLITGFECADFYKGAKAVSGDYYDFIPLGNGLWGFIVADVSGKGIPGSMVMAVTRTIVRLIANRHQSHAAETLKETNRLIAKQIKRGMFVTSFYAILDERTGTLTYASAGHNPMVIYRAASRGCELATGKGIALGFNEGPIFDKTIEEHRTILKPGDAIVIYTDGFPEAMNAQNQEFGDDHFYQMIAQAGHLDARTLIQRLVDAVAKHRGDAEQSDDLTLITVRKA
jgi:serine phosphatase RsbU (regulator of sigma subunit)